MNRGTGISKGLSVGTKHGNKRKAELSPSKKSVIKKRSALGDLTNAAKKKVIGIKGKPPIKAVVKVVRPEDVERIIPPRVTRSRSKSLRPSVTKSTDVDVELENQPSVSRTRSKSLTKNILSNRSQSVATLAAGFNKKHHEASHKSKKLLPSKAVTKPEEDGPEVVEDSLLYTTAVQTPDVTQLVKEMNRKNDELTEEKKSTFPEGVNDFDSECSDDPFQLGLYAKDIFSYYSRRELRFPVKKYLEKQSELNRNMRSILVDWMVEVQENFELNHETLYMAVKLVDLFLGKVFVKRDRLQLVGTTALYVASKFDERSPPIIDDFCYICDDAYPQEDLIRMETRLLKALGFDIGLPLSYRFLRRFARCAKIEMETLTLARFILETCLMEYDLIDTRDSMMAGAALWLAIKLNTVKGSWTPTLEFYSGYKSDDLFDLTHRIFNVIRNMPPHLKTIKAKYSHKIFYEVAKTSIPEELNL